MESIIKELWRGNIIPQDDSRNNSKEMKDLINYMARHHDDLLKEMADAQKEIFEKFDDCWSEYTSLGECAIFCYAFKLGMRIAIETLSKQVREIGCQKAYLFFMVKIYTSLNKKRRVLDFVPSLA